MAAGMLLAFWIGLGAAASGAEVIEGPTALTTAEAGAVYEATSFSLEQVGAQHLLVGMERDTFVRALVSHHASTAQADRSALRRLHERWSSVRSDWPIMSASERRNFVHDVIAVTYGRAIAAELIRDDTFVVPPEAADAGAERREVSLTGP